MSLNELTTEEKKILAAGELLAYYNDTMVAEPPSHRECIFELFCSFRYTGSCRSGETPTEKLHGDFPDIVENELTELIEYFKQAEYYCNNVCCAYSMKYPYYPVDMGKTEEEREDIAMVVKACRQRYPWLEEEYIKKYLKGVIAMSIR